MASHISTDAGDITLEVRDLHTCFHTHEGVLPVVDGVSFTLRRGQVLGLHAFASIDVELKKLYEALAERDLAAGSPAARRLFS